VQLLNAHGQISIGMERYISRLLSGKGLSPELFEERRFFSVEKGDTFYEDLEFFKPFYASLRLKWQDSVVIGDKIPKLYTKYDQVFDRFPEARIIFASRNLIDVASSYKRRAEDASDQEWSRDRGALRAIDDWNAANAQTLTAIDRFPAKIHVLGYESLFIDGKGLEELFDFVGLEPTQDVCTHFQIQMQRSSEIRAQRSETLSADEKLAICLRADSQSFRRLVEKSPVAPVGALRNPSKFGMASPHKVAILATVHENPLANLSPASRTKPKVGKYQDSDSAICDYKYTQLPGTESWVRGPIPEDLSGNFVACLGGAHTLGRFVKQPYPVLLQKQLGIPVLNVGHGGGKPEFYLQSTGLLEVINKAKCVVIQVMSARGSPNRFLKPTSYSHNIMSIADGLSTGKNPVFVNAAYRILLRQLNPEELREAIIETRANWMVEMGRLFERIVIPKVLFWFSVRTPAYIEKFSNLDALFGEYPQFVTEEMVGALGVEADGFVQCVSRSGMPYALRDAKSREPVRVFPWQQDPSVNYYYPSAEMHTEAADSLAPILRRLML
jgi:hypothetical protein